MIFMVRGSQNRGKIEPGALPRATWATFCAQSGSKRRLGALQERFDRFLNFAGGSPNRVLAPQGILGSPQPWILWAPTCAALGVLGTLSTRMVVFAWEVLQILLFRQTLVL